MPHFFISLETLISVWYGLYITLLSTYWHPPPLTDDHLSSLDFTTDNSAARKPWWLWNQSLIPWPSFPIIGTHRWRRLQLAIIYVGVNLLRNIVVQYSSILSYFHSKPLNVHQAHAHSPFNSLTATFCGIILFNLVWHYMVGKTYQQLTTVDGSVTLQLCGMEN